MNDSILKLALSFYGISEIPGAKHNPIITGWFDEIGFDRIRDDETAWCSCFVNVIAHRLKLEKSGRLNARSWLNIGREVKDPEPGDLVVLWRKSIDDWRGHVGFFINYSVDKKYIHILGGNQGNKVCVAPYPTKRLLSFRKLV